MKSIVPGIAAAAILISGTCLAQTNRDNAAAASGDTNQAVATTSANAGSPASGSNSFTMNEAKARFEKQGFSNVSDLQKDDRGIWHGRAQKNGSTDHVWLDYKGNIGVTN